MTDQKNLQTTDLERLSQLLDSLAQAKEDSKEKKTIEEKIMVFFRENGIKSYRYGDIVIRFTDERTTNEFDVDLLRQRYPKIWEECHAENTRPPHLQIRKKKSKKADEEDDVPTDEELAEAMAAPQEAAAK